MPLESLEIPNGQTIHDLLTVNEKIIPALDYDNWAEAQIGLNAFADFLAIAKVNSLAERDLDGSVKKLNQYYDLLVMVDRKVFDIDDTNRRRIRDQTLAGGSILTVHGGNTQSALKACVEGIDEALQINPKLKSPWLAGVTVLTNIGDEGFDAAGEPIETCTSIYGDNRQKKVAQFTGFIADAGFQAVVCSAQEAEQVKKNPNTAHLVTIVPAIRPEYTLKEQDEQRYTAVTPKRAVELGADLLVIGRPLINARYYGLMYHEAIGSITTDMAAAA